MVAARQWSLMYWSRSGGSGSLLPESQQFSPWIKAAPFVPTRKYVVKVPSFFASKKSNAAPEKPKTTKKTPVVVVRTGKPVSKVIRLEKESLEVHNEENIEPVFQEAYQQGSRLSTEEGIMEDLILQQAGLVEEKVSIKSFKEVIREIDKGIKKYDSQSIVSPSFGDSIGKENYVGYPRINEANMLYTSTHAAHLSLSPIVPLA
nr:hypothetical protein CFP56_49730 [Quercus suber]